ncbi:unnamed protein product [Spirodela intermedia]|uniref:Uncharacterized protein n=2 Tax=Spirodela intermedia TaxID=51605 RepID=A0A7I8IS29_SPIIN|nr:unnamed protein product [Spirodela intermedia]CAA6660787.1 unnamed protein product [Spirodela intermedia]CAA7397139.1 unnamed protein product [Spirodela intermedia]
MAEGGHKSQYPILFLGRRRLPLDFSKISLLGSPWIGPRLSWVSPSGPPSTGPFSSFGPPSLGSFGPPLVGASGIP